MADRESMLENALIEMAILMMSDIRAVYKQIDKRQLNNRLNDIVICLEQVERHKIKTIMSDIKKIRKEINSND